MPNYAKVVQRKFLLLTKDLNTIPIATDEWDQFVDVEFIPDEMIVRSASYYDDGTTVATYLTSNLVGYDPMCLLIDAKSVSHPDTVFKLERQIRGLYRFEVRDLAGTASATASGKLCIILEFVQYEK